MISFGRWFRRLRRKGRHRAPSGETGRAVVALVLSGEEHGALRAADVATVAVKLRDVCAALLETGECDAELARWCVRMRGEPGAAERAVKAASTALDPTEPRSAAHPARTTGTGPPAPG